MRRVSNRHGCAIVCSHVKYSRGTRQGAVDKSVEVVAAQERQHLSTPEKVVVRAQLHRQKICEVRVTSRASVASSRDMCCGQHRRRRLRTRRRRVSAVHHRGRAVEQRLAVWPSTVGRRRRAVGHEGRVGEDRRSGRRSKRYTRGRSRGSGRVWRGSDRRASAREKQSCTHRRDRRRHKRRWRLSSEEGRQERRHVRGSHRRGQRRRRGGGRGSRDRGGGG